MTYLSFNFANWVTVAVMVFTLFGLLALAQKSVVSLQEKNG